MANYTTENLVPVLNPQTGVLAIRVGDQVFPLPGGVDVSTTTAQPEDVRSGKYFFTAAGIRESGTIPTVSATSSGSQITVPVGYIASPQTFNVSGDSVYLCVSASPNMQYNLFGAVYGGAYVYDGQLDGKDVYTNGTYYAIWPSSYGGAGNPASSAWHLHSARSWAAEITDVPSISLLGTFVTSGGQVMAWQPEVLSSGTWTGREMVAGSDGYYEPVASGSETSLAYTRIMPEAGQMYSADALKHIDQIWNYLYKCDLISFRSSAQNEIRPDGENWFDGVSGPDANGWFTFGNGAYGTFGLSSYDGNYTSNSRFNCFTLAFSFKYASGTLLEDSNVNTLLRLEGGYSIFQIGLFSDGSIAIGNSATMEGDTSIPFQLAPDTEYDFVVACDNEKMQVVINGILVAYWRSRQDTDAISQVYIHWYGGNPSESTFCYKDIRLWGRVLDSLAVYSSASAYVPVSSGDKVIVGEMQAAGWTVTSAARMTVYGGGRASSVQVESAHHSSAGLFVLSGGTVNGCTVSSGGRLVVYGGGTALNVTSQPGAIIVNSGGTIS